MKQIFNKKTRSFLITLVLLIAIAKIISLIFYIYLPKTSIEISKKDNILVEYKRYNSANSFKLKNAKVIIQQEKPKDLIDITQFELLAIYKDEFHGYVIIKNKKNNEIKLIKINQSYEGYLLKQIYLQEAVFEKNSTKYSLKFNKNSKLAQYEIQNITKEDDIKSNISRDELKQYTTDMSKIWNNIAIQERMKNGNIDGFEVLSVKRGSVFENLGLKKGDVILKVNNKELKSYADAFEIYNNIDNLNVVKLDIIRGNEKKELEYEIF